MSYISSWSSVIVKYSFPKGKIMYSESLEEWKIVIQFICALIIF